MHYVVEVKQLLAIDIVSGLNVRFRLAVDNLSAPTRLGYPPTPATSIATLSR